MNGINILGLPHTHIYTHLTDCYVDFVALMRVYWGCLIVSA